MIVRLDQSTDSLVDAFMAHWEQFADQHAGEPDLLRRFVRAWVLNLSGGVND